VKVGHVLVKPTDLIPCSLEKSFSQENGFGFLFSKFQGTGQRHRVTYSYLYQVKWGYSWDIIFLNGI
jgi:hypothetical protein